MKFNYMTRMLIASAVLTGAAHAQNTFPTRPIQVIAPVSVGGVADIAGRIYAEKLAKVLNQPVVVQNRPGAGTVIGTQSVATAAPDGYTLLVTNSAFSITPFIQPGLPFDTARDFTGVAMVAEAPAVVAVASVSGIKTLKDLIALAKAKPGTINYSSAGIGSATHLAGAHFAAKAGINIVHVPYKNYSDANIDFIAGRVPLIFAPAGFLLPFIREGKVTALGVSTADDMSEPFAAPSVKKAMGIDYEFATWYGFLAPSKTPATVLDVLGKAMTQISADPEVKEKLRSQGIIPRNVVLRDFDAYMKTEVEKVRPLINASDIKTN